MKRLSAVALFAVLLLVATSVAGAAASKPKLSFTKTNAQIGWSNEGGSSPSGGVSNTNNQSLKINATGPQGNSGASAYTYGTDEDLVGLRGLTLAQISHLGFDSKGYLGAGAPRISMETLGTSGTHQYWLVASYCNDPTSGGWRTSDFVNDTTNCTIFRDGVQMTWAAAVALATTDNEHVNATPGDWFLVVDEAPSLTYVDRLSVQNWCWTGNGTNGTINSDSGDCI
jgi:archaellum component FlaG (FlaF/FlaG flagellin family)